MKVTRHRAQGKKPPGLLSSVVRQQWFIEMLPSTVNGEVRLRLQRPASWICVAEAAELIACGIQKVHYLCEDGQLEWRWLDYEGKGGKKLILVDSIQQYLAKKFQPHSARPAPRRAA